MLDDPPLSWRLRTGGGEPIRTALFVRDAARLDVSATVDIPPLAAVVPTDAELPDRVVAAEQWGSWWQQVVDLESDDPPTQAESRVSRARYLMARHEAVCDPPRFTALADRPALQMTARAVFGGYRAWEAATPAWDRADLSGSVFDNGLIDRVARDVAFDHRVELDQLRGYIAFLPIDGPWWARIAPGVVLCSIAAAEEPVMAQTLLRDVFASGLAR